MSLRHPLDQTALTSPLPLCTNIVRFNCSAKHLGVNRSVICVLVVLIGYCSQLA